MRVRVPPVAAIFASREPLAGLRTKSTRGKPGSPRHQCGSAELGTSKRINCPRLPGDREPRRGCAGSYFTVKETSHAIRHHDRPVRSRGRRVRAADGAGVEAYGAPGVVRILRRGLGQPQTPAKHIGPTSRQSSSRELRSDRGFDFDHVPPHGYVQLFRGSRGCGDFISDNRQPEKRQ